MGRFLSLRWLVRGVFVSGIHPVHVGRNGFLDSRNFVLSAFLASSHESSRGRRRVLAGCDVACTDLRAGSLKYSRGERQGQRFLASRNFAFTALWTRPFGESRGRLGGRGGPGNCWRGVLVLSCAARA